MEIEPKDFIQINGVDLMFKERRFRDDDGEELAAMYQDGIHFLPQEYIYEDADGVEIGISPDHPSQEMYGMRRK